MSSSVTTTDEDRVRVVVRARPLLPAERQASSQECVQFVDRRQLFMGKKAFLFDAAFDPLTPQVNSRRPLAFTHTHAYTRIHTHTHSLTHTLTLTHTHIHTHTHTRIHTLTSASVCS
jgi:hypothetical protein